MPFTADQFFAVFAAYNQAIWPAQIVAYVLALVGLAAIFTRPAAGHGLMLGVLALLWLWNGIAYHLMFFTRINSVAYGFAAMFILQGLLFVAQAAKPISTWPSIRLTPKAMMGAVLITYGMVLYSVLGSWLGHPWPSAPIFGVAPCPTTIFTFGVLILVPGPVPAWLLIIPLTWSAIGSTAAILLSVPEDLGLLAAGLIGAGWLTARAIWRANRGPIQRT